MPKVIPFPAQSIHRDPEIPRDLPSPWFLRVMALLINTGLWVALGIIAWEIFRP